MAMTARALHRGDTGAQARLCLSRIESALTALGGSLQDVVRTGVYLAPGASWEQAARRASATCSARSGQPARCCMSLNSSGMAS